MWVAIGRAIYRDSLDIVLGSDTLKAVARSLQPFSHPTGRATLQGPHRERRAVNASRLTVPPRLAIALATWLFVACCLVAADAGEPPQWTTDRAQAAALARKSGRLLLVVHVSGDFTTRAADCVEAQLYQRHILGDERVAAALKDRFVVVCQLVGQPQILSQWPSVSAPAGRDDQAPASRTSQRPLEMAVAYVCLPDERVLHFVPGFVSAGELADELAWLETVYSRMLQAGEAELAKTLRTAHREVLFVEDREAFAGQFPTRWPADQPAPECSTVDLPAALAGARAVWDWSQRDRLGFGGRLEPIDSSRIPLRAVPRSGKVGALASHGRLGPDFAHLVLSEFPLVYLSDLAEPAYTAITGERMWQASKRRAELAAWWAACARQGRRTLLVVEDDAASTTAAESTAWTDAEAVRMAELWRVAAQKVSVDELAALLADAKLPPLPVDRAAGPPRFVLHDARGARCGELLAGQAGPERLEALLRKAVGGGGPAVTASGRGAGAVRPELGVQNEGESDANP
jgi:hypothetical protein